MADYFKLTFELAETPGRQLFVLCKTEEKVDEKIKQLQKDFTLTSYEVTTIE